MRVTQKCGRSNHIYVAVDQAATGSYSENGIGYFWHKSTAFGLGFYIDTDHIHEYICLKCHSLMNIATICSGNQNLGTFKIKQYGKAKAEPSVET
jgi:hypothetical protein